MKPTTQIIFAFVTGLLSITTLASPLAQGAILSRDIEAPSRMTTTDRFSQSDLDYMTWADQMVAEGKMYWPNKTSSSQIKTRQGSFSLQNIVCGYIGANQNAYEEGKNSFCSLASQFAAVNLMAGEYILQNGLCEDNQQCTFILEIAFGVAGGYVQDGVPSVCGPIFDELWGSCAASVGGSAQLVVYDSEGTQSGTVQAQFYSLDTGATCPANTDTDVCGISDF